MNPGNKHPSQPSSPQPAPANAGDISRESAANLIREQLNSLYGASDTPPHPGKVGAAATTKQQSVLPTPQATQASPTVDSGQWKQYHSAWQDYYQKYYQQYYTSYAHRVIKQQSKQQLPESAQTATPAAPAETTVAKSESPSEATPQKEQINKLRNSIVTKARQQAKKARGSRHFVPLAAAICVVLLFSFLQYNQVLFGNVQAYISPGAIDPQNVIIDPTTDVAVSPEPKLIIPELNINVPVIYGIGADDKSQLAAMEKGVAHWPGGQQAKSVPGQAGNTVIAGHSSNDIFGAGEFKFIFSQLERLEAGDTIYMNYEGKRYTYNVTRKDIVLPKGEWQSVITYTDKPMLVLVTCWPLGTAQKRLLVTAEQTSPDPAAATAAPAESTEADDTTTETMTGTSPTFLEILLGLFR